MSAESPLCPRSGSRRLLVVRLRTVEKTAVLRRFAQGRAVHSGEIHRSQGRETGPVRVQAHAYAAVLRRHAQEPVTPVIGTRGRAARPAQTRTAEQMSVKRFTARPKPIGLSMVGAMSGPVQLASPTSW